MLMHYAYIITFVKAGFHKYAKRNPPNSTFDRNAAKHKSWNHVLFHAMCCVALHICGKWKPVYMAYGFYCVSYVRYVSWKLIQDRVPAG